MAVDDWFVDRLYGLAGSAKSAEEAEELRGIARAARAAVEASRSSPSPAVPTTEYVPLTKDADWRKRCDRCGWTLAESREKGCAVGDCSYRGDSKIGFVPSPERELRTDLRACESALQAALSRAGATRATTWKCKARACNMGDNDPAECDWPICDCDPAAERVKDALDECGFTIVKKDEPSPSSPATRASGYERQSADAERAMVAATKFDAPFELAGAKLSADLRAAEQWAADADHNFCVELEARRHVEQLLSAAQAEIARVKKETLQTLGSAMRKALGPQRMNELLADLSEQHAYKELLEAMR